MTEKNNGVYRLNTNNWHVVRAVYFIGGFFVVCSVALAMFVDFRWMYFTFFVGGMFVIFALTGYCPMAIMLNKAGVCRK